MPNTNPLPKHTLHLWPPSNPLAGPELSSAHCGCGRHVNRPSGDEDTSATAPAGFCPALAPSRPRTVDLARQPPSRLLRPEPHPTASELPPLAALSAPVTRPEVGVREERGKEPEFAMLLLLGGSWVEPRGREQRKGGGSSKVPGLRGGGGVRQTWVPLRSTLPLLSTPRFQPFPPSLRGQFC